MPNSKTLVQAILAAFCAILCTHLSALGGGGMNIGARTAAWAKSGYTAKDYGQDGIFTHFDAIENNGYGKHDDTLKSWTDLKIGLGFLPIYPCSFSNGSVVYDGLSSQVRGSVSQQFRDGMVGDWSLEVCCKKLDGGTPIIISVYPAGLNPGFADNDTYGVRFQTTGWNGTRRKVNIGEAMTLGVSLSGRLMTVYINGVYFESNTIPDTTARSVPTHLYGNCGYYSYFGIRFYSRDIGAQQFAANYAIDKARFGLT